MRAHAVLKGFIRDYSFIRKAIVLDCTRYRLEAAQEPCDATVSMITADDLRKGKEIPYGLIVCYCQQIPRSHFPSWLLSIKTYVASHLHHDVDNRARTLLLDIYALYNFDFY